MTKPIVSVAAMTLWEEGVFELDDPISKWIPSFENVRVYDRGIVQRGVPVPAIEPVRVWHLLTHTSGSTAGFLYTRVVDALYRAAGYDPAPPPDPRGVRRRLGAAAAALPAGHQVGLRRLDRRRRPADRDLDRPDAGRRVRESW